MPNPAPQRAETPRHLDPPGVRLERALLARAATLSERGQAMPAGSDTSHMLLTISAEFVELASELHYW